jgi:uncharacterized Zn finger protein
MGYYSEFAQYHSATAGEIKAKSIAYLQKAAAKKKELHPVVLEGRTITKSWWGTSWCTNLERYADYEARLDRGRKYVRAGAVVDLGIEEGVIHGAVLGSRAKPYEVQIEIQPLAEGVRKKLAEQCSSKIENIESLVRGTFPDPLKDLFYSKGGLFPSPREIHFNCTCPDWASLCKHVAAVLYGVGTRFDEDPLLFFKLRGIDVNDFIDKAISNRVEQMLSHVNRRTDRMMDDDTAAKLFDVIR